MFGPIGDSGSLLEAEYLSVFKPTIMGRNLFDVTKKSAKSDYCKRAINTKFRDNCNNPV